MRTSSERLYDILNSIRSTDYDDDNLFSSSRNILNRQKLNNIFIKSSIIRKIIKLLPSSAANNGYRLVNESGETVEKTDRKLMNALKDAIIQARLFGSAYLVINDGFDPSKPLTKGIKDHQVLFDLEQVGDFYTDGSVNVAHVSKVFAFYGDRTYLLEVEQDEPQYAVSILQGLFIALKDFDDAVKISKGILQNLSNLTLGVQGLGMKLKTDKKSVFDRLLSFDLNRKNSKAILYDLANEKLEYISQSIAQIPDYLETLKLLFVANTEYPKEKLFKESSQSGLGSGIQNQMIVRFEWAVQVQEFAEEFYAPHLERYFELLGYREVEVVIPLPMKLTKPEEIEIQRLGAERSEKLVSVGVIAPREIRSGYDNSEFDPNIVLDEATYSEFLKTQNKSGEAPTEAPTEAPPPESPTESIDTPTEYWIDLAKVTELDVEKFSESIL